MGTPAMAWEGRTISLRAGGRPSVVEPSAFASGLRRCMRNRSSMGRESARLRPGLLRSSVRTRPASAVSSLVHNPSEPVPAIATQLGMPAERTTTPQCSPSGSAAVGPAGEMSIQATSAASAGQRGLNLVQLRRLPCQRTVIPNDLGLELTQGDARQRGAGVSIPRTGPPARFDPGPWVRFPPVCRAFRVRLSIPLSVFARRL